MMLSELLADLERRRLEARRLQTSAPLETVYANLIDQLKDLEGVPTDGMVGLATAAGLLGVSTKTLAKRCNQGVYPGAQKTSERGHWRIPLAELANPATLPVTEPSSVATADGVRLWRR